DVGGGVGGARMVLQAAPAVVAGAAHLVGRLPLPLGQAVEDLPERQAVDRPRRTFVSHLPAHEPFLLAPVKVRTLPRSFGSDSMRISSCRTTPASTSVSALMVTSMGGSPEAATRVSSWPRAAFTSPVGSLVSPP